MAALLPWQSYLLIWLTFAYVHIYTFTQSWQLPQFRSILIKAKLYQYRTTRGAEHKLGSSPKEWSHLFSMASAARAWSNSSTVPVSSHMLPSDPRAQVFRNTCSSWNSLWALYRPISLSVCQECSYLLAYTMRSHRIIAFLTSLEMHAFREQLVCSTALISGNHLIRVIYLLTAIFCSTGL